MFTAIAATTSLLSSCLNYDEPGDELNMNKQIYVYENPNSAPIISLAMASYTLTVGEMCDVTFNVKDQDGDAFILNIEDDSNCSSILSAISTNGTGVVVLADDKLSLIASGTRSGVSVVLRYVPTTPGTYSVKLVANDIKDNPEDVYSSDRTLTFTVNAAQ